MSHCLCTRVPASSPPGTPSTVWRVLCFRHNEVAREVLEASKVVADDPVKQFAISFFDNKFNSLVPLKITYFLR